ncbi:hypothetical protein JTB14_027766 [Gonioctena quinquepunctata]|nr:hypothetical protein JTB14_027766 [Gonioctena quinquepunctata]
MMEEKTVTILTEEIIVPVEEEEIIVPVEEEEIIIMEDVALTTVNLKIQKCNQGIQNRIINSLQTILMI